MKNHKTIHEAAEKGDLADVKRHLQRGVKVNARDENGSTPLMSAVMCDHLDVVKYLVAKGADVNAKSSNNGTTPLMSAAMRDLLDMVKYLIANGADVNAKDSEGTTPLMLAATWGHLLDVVEFLVSNGADVNAKDSKGTTPLILAGVERMDAVKFLIDNGADVNAKGKDERTLLIYATMCGSLDAVKYLVAKGADVNTKDNKGLTPPMHAVNAGHLDVAKYLTANGADIDIIYPDNAEPPMKTTNIVTLDGQEFEYKALFIDGSELRPEAYRFVTVDQTIVVIPRRPGRFHGVPAVFQSSDRDVGPLGRTGSEWSCNEESFLIPAFFKLYLRPHTAPERNELALTERRAMSEPSGSAADMTGCEPRNPPSIEQNEIAGITEEPHASETLARLAQAERTLSSGILYAGKGTTDMSEKDRLLFNLIREMNPGRKGWALSYMEIGSRLCISPTEVGRRRKDFENRFPNFAGVIAEARQNNDGRMSPDKCDSGHKINTRPPPENPSESD